MKRFAPVLLVLLACLVLAPVVFAQTPRGCDPGGWQPGDGTQFSAVGTVSAAPVADGGGGGTISMAVDHGCPNLDGSTITVNVADHAQLFSVADCQRSPIDFSGISQGDEVALCGTIDASSGSPVYDASRVCVRQPEFSCTGTVSAVDTTNDLLTVNVTKGSAGLASPLTVAITSNTQITGDASTVSEASPVAALRCDDNTITLNQVIVAEQVRICGTIDDSSGTPVYDASRVWVRQARFFCEGAVSQIDTTNDRLSVDVAHGSAGLSGTTALAISADTQLFSFADFACGQIDLSQVSVGDQVAVCGTIDASSGTAVYDARVVFDCGADPLPAPTSHPTSLSTRVKNVARGKFLKVHLRVTDAMPGCSTAEVSVAVVNAKGTKVATRTVSGVALNKAVSLSVKLHKALTRGTYHVVTKALDDAGNRQLRAGSAVLRVH